MARKAKASPQSGGGAKGTDAIGRAAMYLRESISQIRQRKHAQAIDLIRLALDTLGE